MYSHDVQLRVRYGETDQMGYLYYGRYAEYFEVGRVETIRSLGLSYKTLEEEYGIWLPVVSMEMRFVRPAYYDDVLTVHTEIRKLPDAYITFHSELFNDNRKLVNAGTVRLLFLPPGKRSGPGASTLYQTVLNPYFNP
ncbi:MAG: acyl-CoA thioesterase [Saprospirales bacterium]|nr:acyl-CoA thioesterase [Saprospirales bacterium]